MGAARDLNPEPADKESAPKFDLPCRKISVSAGTCRFVTMDPRGTAQIVPGNAGPYRNIRASTEQARMKIGLDQSSGTCRTCRRRICGDGPELPLATRGR